MKFIGLICRRGPIALILLFLLFSSSAHASGVFGGAGGSGSGDMLASEYTSDGKITPAKGGTGQDTSAWSGLPKITTGTWFEQAITANVWTLLGAADYAAFRTSLLVGKFTTGTGTAGGACTAGDLYYETDAKIWSLCVATDTWAQIYAVGADGSYYIQVGNNSSYTPSAGVYRYLFEAGVPKVDINGTEKSIALLDAPVFTTSLQAPYYIVGSGGPLIKNESGTVAFRNTGDTDYAPIKFLSITITGAVDFTAATSGTYPCEVGTAAAPTGEARCYYNSSTHVLTWGNGTVAERSVKNTETFRLATFAWDGGGSAVTAGATSKRCTTIPHAGTITGWTLTNQQADTVSIHVYKDAYSADAVATTSITDTHDPATSATVAATDADLSDWTTVAVTANDSICAEVHAAAAATWINLVIWGTR